MSQVVLLAHTRAMGPAARAIAAELRRLGYDTTQITPPAGGHRMLRNRLAACQRVLVMCAGKTGVASALRGLAAQAEAAGKLVVLQLDSGASRARPGSARLAPLGRRRAPQWRRLILGEDGSVRPRCHETGALRSTSRADAALTTGVLALVGSAAAYVTDAAFAARVDELARLAKSQAAVLVSGFIG